MLLIFLLVKLFNITTAFYSTTFSGFASMQSIRASTQSISTKRSSEHSTQSHKSSIASSTEITSLKHTDSKLGSDIDDLLDQSFMNNQSKTTSCFSNQAFSSERCITTSCNFLRSANEMCSSNKVLNESESVSLHSEKSMTKTMFSTNKLENQDGFLNTFASSPQSIREEPPALPVKTRGKGMSKERLVSHYDNVEEHDHSPRYVLHVFYRIYLKCKLKYESKCRFFFFQ